MSDTDTRAIQVMERIDALGAQGAIAPADLEFIAAVIRDQHRKIRDLREIKDGYLASMIAWRKLAEDGTPLEETQENSRQKVAAGASLH